MAKRKYKHNAATRKKWREQGANKRAKQRAEQAAAREGAVDPSAALAPAVKTDTPARRGRGKGEAPAAAGPAEHTAAPAIDVALDVVHPPSAGSSAAPAAVPAVDEATAPVAGTKTDTSAPAAAAPAVEGATAHTAVPSLRESLEGLLNHGTVLAIGTGIGWGNAAQLSPVMDYLAPGWGLVSAVSLVAAEAAAGHKLCEALGIGQHVHGATNGMPEGMRRVYVALLLSLVLFFPALEVALSFVREAAVHQAAVVAAADKPAAPTHCEREKMPAGLNSYRIKQWDAGAATREAAYEACRRQERAEQKEDRGDLVQAADAHSPWETPARAGLAVALSLIVAVCAMSFGSFVRALLAIAPGFVALFRRAPAPATAPELAPVLAPGATPTAAPAAAPAAREGWLRRLAYQPVRWLMRPPAPAGAA
jgi:hypothetical protein